MNIEVEGVKVEQSAHLVRVQRISMEPMVRQVVGLEVQLVGSVSKVDPMQIDTGWSCGRLG